MQRKQSEKEVCERLDRGVVYSQSYGFWLKLKIFCSSIKPLKSREEQFKLALDDLARQVRAEREEQSMYEELKKYGNLKKNRSYINHSQS